MTKLELKAQNKIKEAFIKRAKQEGITVYKNHIKTAKPLTNFCGFIKTEYPSEIDDLVCGR